jgi:rubrerythrin
MPSSPSSPDAASVADLRVPGVTRGAFILRGALATAAAAGAGTVGPFVQRALAQSDASDAAIFDFAFRLESLEVAFYKQALQQVPGMATHTRRLVRELLDHEREHKSTISETVLQLGIKHDPSPAVDFGPSFQSEKNFLGVAAQLEEVGVGAYNGALPRVFSRQLLVVIGTIAQIEARHAAVVRDLLGRPIADAAFDKPRTEAEVANAIRPFVK